MTMPKSDSAFRVGGRPFNGARLRQLVAYLNRAGGRCEHGHLHTSAWAEVEGYAPGQQVAQLD